MEYTLNDTTAYGIYNGLSHSVLDNMIRIDASNLGLDIFDYSTEEIIRQLNRDLQLKEIAQASYKPNPIQDGDKWPNPERLLAEEKFQKN